MRGTKPSKLSGPTVSPLLWAEVDALKQRLTDAQDAIRSALDTDPAHLPDILAARDGDLRTLAEGLRRKEVDRCWARAYLERDEKLLTATTASRDAARDQLSAMQKRKSAQRAYISTGRR
ncbi:MAG: hypothetical protein ACI9WU_002717 [Myxococcota bacterium]|jgi:hypothetical protein